MEINELINQKVIHKIFGKGIINNIEGKYLKVHFQEKNKVSKFTFPSCFYGFLTLEDNKLQLEMQAVVDTWKEENDIIQKEQRKEQYEETIAGIKMRRKEAEEKRLRAVQRSAGIIKMQNNS